MTEKTAFITGATGFTGSHLARRLRQEGWRVKCLVRPQSDFKLPEDLQCEIVTGDLTNPHSYEQALSDVEVLFHIAAFYRDQAHDDVFWKVNFEGTKQLVNAAIRAKVKKFIHCSTAGVHGAVEHPPADESAPFRPGYAYQESKLAAERFVYEKMQSGDLVGSIFRPTGIYGPGDRRLLKLFKMADAPVTLILGKGKFLYHLTYVDDLIDGILLLEEKPEAEGQIFILAGDEYIELSQLISLIGAIMGTRVHFIQVPFKPVYFLATITEYIGKILRINPILYRRRLDFFWKDRAFISYKAKTMLGYQPRFSLEKGLENTLNWYKEQGWIK